MIFIYKEIVKKYIKFLTISDIKKYSHSINENISDEEATIIYNHINKYYEELLEGNTNSFHILNKNLRKDLFDKIVLLYNEAKTKYL